MEKTLDASKVLASLDGKPIVFNEEELTMGKAISAMLLQSKSEDKVMAYELAKKWYDGGKVVLSHRELNFTREEIVDSSAFLPIVSGQLLLMLG